jgi:hypothetical protein
MLALLLAAQIAGAALTPPLRPDPALTPGANDPAVLSHVDLATLCTPGYTARPGVRHVTPATKAAVFAAYRIDPRVGGPYEIDHLCSLELGCTNDPKNLWPQSYVTRPWNAHLKDALEDRLHALVCPSRTNPEPIPLAQAQAAISTDWTAAYVRYIGPAPQ